MITQVNLQLFSLPFITVQVIDQALEEQLKLQYAAGGIYGTQDSILSDDIIHQELLRYGQAGTIYERQCYYAEFDERYH